MQLTRLRKQRDELILVLSDKNNGHRFEPVQYEFLEACSRGRCLHKFYDEFTRDNADDDDKYPLIRWVSEYHEKFYNVCKKIVELEQSEYKKAMAMA